MTDSAPATCKTCLLSALADCAHCKFEHPEIAARRDYPRATLDDVRAMWAKLWGSPFPEFDFERE